MEALLWSAVALVSLGLLTLLAGILTCHTKRQQAGMLLSASGAILTTVYNLHGERYGLMAATLALAALNVGSFLWSRSDERKKAAAE